MLMKRRFDWIINDQRPSFHPLTSCLLFINIDTIGPYFFRLLDTFFWFNNSIALNSWGASQLVTRREPYCTPVVYVYIYIVTCGEPLLHMAYKPFPKRGLVKMITIKTYHILGNKRPFTSYDLGYHPGPRALTHQCRVSWGRTLRGSQPRRPQRRGLGDWKVQWSGN
jgi:hypothetical protein